MMSKAYKMARSFQRKAGQPAPKHPSVLDKKRVKLRIKWMKEELQELSDASDIYQQADALTDLLYYLMGTYVEMGINPWTLYKIVHRANMKKITSSGGIIKDGEGKVQKPSGWKHPDQAVRRAIGRM